MDSYDIASSGNIAILDLAQTLEVFLPHFNRRVSEFGLKGRVKLVMAPAKHIAKRQVILEADGEKLNIITELTHNNVRTTLELNCQQMVDLMFSPMCIGYSYMLDKEARWLAMLMPVPFSIPMLYKI